MAIQNKKRPTTPPGVPPAGHPTLPGEVLYHAVRWLDDYHAARPSQRPLLGYCENAALVIESRAYEALTKQGRRLIVDMTGADPEAIRLAWVNEAMHSCDFCLLDSPEYLAFTAILCAADLRAAIENRDAEMAGLGMMGMVAAAIEGGYQLQLDRVEELEIEHATAAAIVQEKQRAFNEGIAKKNLAYAAIRLFCIARAAELWTANKKIRIGEMIDTLQALIAAESKNPRRLPVGDRGIRNWLNQANVIPVQAKKPGRPPAKK